MVRSFLTGNDTLLRLKSEAEELYRQLYPESIADNNDVAISLACETEEDYRRYIAIMRSQLSVPEQKAA